MLIVLLLMLLERIFHMIVQVLVLNSFFLRLCPIFYGIILVQMLNLVYLRGVIRGIVSPAKQAFEGSVAKKRETGISALASSLLLNLNAAAHPISSN